MTSTVLQNEAGPSSFNFEQRAPLRSVAHRRHHVRPPAHHVVQPSNTLAQVWRENVPLMPTLMPTQSEKLYSTEKTSVFLNAGPERSIDAEQTQAVDAEQESSAAALNGGNVGGDSDGGGGRGGYVRLGFQNPWNSWHKPTLSEVWSGLRWGWGGQKSSTDEEMERYKNAIEVARQRESGHFDDLGATNGQNASAKAAEKAKEQTKVLSDGLQSGDLNMQMPDFSASEHDADHVRATWLGHATVCLQFPGLNKRNAKPVRILFDPIFSLRCSPTQYLGPVRLFPAPCSVADLPPIDVVCISHSHYDHLDYDSIVQLWQANKEHIRFVVPLGNKAWFLGLNVGIEEDRVIELDWWDEVWMTNDEGQEAEADDADFRLRFVCTPAQHGSGRYGFDAGRSLWSSWTVERTPTVKAATSENTFRAFFGGDSGFQFHSSSPQAAEYTTCPAFEEVHRVLGAPNVSFLPISVGATLNFVKSYDTFGLMPDMDSGLTGANHMTPFDAVRVARILAGFADPFALTRRPSDAQSTDTRRRSRSLAVAIHWGTFVSGMDEIRKSMRDLEAACDAQEVEYIRRWKDARRESASKLAFACIDHGDSVWMSLTTS